MWSGLGGCPELPRPQRAHGQQARCARPVLSLEGFSKSLLSSPKSQTAARRGSSLGTGRGPVRCLGLGRKGPELPPSRGLSGSTGARALSCQARGGHCGPRGSGLTDVRRQLAAVPDVFGSRRGLPPTRHSGLSTAARWTLPAARLGAGSWPGGRAPGHPNPPTPHLRTAFVHPGAALPGAFCRGERGHGGPLDGATHTSALPLARPPLRVRVDGGGFCRISG